MWIVFWLIFLLFIQSSETVKCYSCATDFVVWNWRHFFLRRNYGITSSDNLCGYEDYTPTLSNECSSSCFVFYLNGTDKETGFTKNLGVGKGCSAQFLSDEQYNRRELGVYSKPSIVSNYLSHDFDKYDIHEYWCFCVGSKCNTDNCFNQWRYNSYHSGYYGTGGRRTHIWSDPYGTGFFNNAPNRNRVIITVLSIIPTIVNFI